jgi:hypothetical protein
MKDYSFDEMVTPTKFSSAPSLRLLFRSRLQRQIDDKVAEPSLTATQPSAVSIPSVSHFTERSALAQPDPST